MLLFVLVGVRRPLDAIREISSLLAAVALGRDVTAAIQNEARGARDRKLRDDPRARPAEDLQRRSNRERLNATSEPDVRHPTESQHRHGRPPHDEHGHVSRNDSIYPPSQPISTTTRQTTAERPKSLDLHRVSSSHSRPSPAADTPNTTPGTTDVGNARRLGSRESEQRESVTSQHGRCTLKVCDVPGTEPSAERLTGSRHDSTTGQSQTPDSGVVVSPLEQRLGTLQPPLAINPDLSLSVNPSGPEYRIAQTPTKSTIIIIRSDSSHPHASGVHPGRTAAPGPAQPSPVHESPPFIVPQSVLQQVAAPGPMTSRQPVNVPVVTPNVGVKETTTTMATATAAGGLDRRSPASTPSDEKILVKLNGGESEQRRYVISAATLTAVQLPATKTHPSAVDSNQTVLESAERRSNEVPRPTKDVQLHSDHRPAVVSPPLQTRASGDRIITSSKPKASTPVAKQRDAKPTAVAKQRPSTAQKRVPANGKGQAGQRSKQSHQAAKQSENRLQLPALLTRSNSKQKDAGLQQTSVDSSQPTFAELRAMFAGSLKQTC